MSQFVAISGTVSMRAEGFSLDNLNKALREINEDLDLSDMEFGYDPDDVADGKPLRLHGHGDISTCTDEVNAIRGAFAKYNLVGVFRVDGDEADNFFFAAGPNEDRLYCGQSE